MVEPVGIVGMAAGAVEAVCADAFFGETDALDEGVDFAELQGGKLQATRYLVDKAAVFGSARCLVQVELCRGVALEVLYDATGDQLHVAFG